MATPRPRLRQHREIPAASCPVPGLSNAHRSDPENALTDAEWLAGLCSISRLHVRIAQPHRKALLIGDDLLERLTEIQLEVRPFGPAEMGRAENVRHEKEWMISVDDRLLFVNVDGGIAGSPLAQRAQQGSRYDEFGARGVHDQCSRLHAIEIVRTDDPVRVARETHMQGQHVGALEQRLLACGTRVSRGGSFLQGGALTP